MSDIERETKEGRKVLRKFPIETGVLERTGRVGTNGGCTCQKEDFVENGVTQP